MPVIKGTCSISSGVTPAGPIVLSSGGSQVLTGAVSTTGTSALTYKWESNGTAISGATLSTYTASAAGTYTMVATNNCGTSTSNAVTITTCTQTAAITAGGATTFCSGGNVVLSANTGTGYTYIWYNNGTVISGATSATYTATASGSYTVKINNGTCSATSSAVTVTVNTLPTASVTPTSASFCSGGSAVLTANTGTGLTYQWQIGNSNISGATLNTYTATIAGTYTCIVTNSCGSATSNSVVVTVNTIASATVTPASAAFCTGSSAVLTANTGTGYTYQWQNSGTKITGATLNTYTAAVAGTYTVVITESCGTATSNAVVVTVNAAPIATVTPSGTVTLTSTLVLTANTGTGITYQWKSGSTGISGATLNTYTPTAAGTYSVAETNLLGCLSTSNSVVVTSSGTLPTVTTTAITNITSGGATGGGDVTAKGSTAVKARGICWATTANPTTANSITSNGTGTGTFTSTLSGLTASTTYYVRAYATNTIGTAYGSQVSFTTSSASANDTILKENFNKFTASSSTKDISSELNSYTETPGWTGLYIYQDGGIAKIGKSGGEGYIITPAVNISGNSGAATLKFDIEKYSSDANVVRAYLATDGVTFTQIGSDITPTTGFVTTTISITGGTSTSKIKISGTNASTGRFLLDNFVLLQNSTGNNLNITGNNEKLDDISVETIPFVSINYPNPFSSKTQIDYNLPETANVILKVYNLVGQEISTLVNSVQEKGKYTVTFNGDNLRNGLYFYSIEIKGQKTNFTKALHMVISR